MFKPRKSSGNNNQKWMEPYQKECRPLTDSSVRLLFVRSTFSALASSLEIHFPNKLKEAGKAHIVLFLGRRNSL
jgi:hypothetical protein